MTRARTLIVIGLATIAAALPAQGAVLRVEDATAQVGSTARVAVSLENPENDVRALQFTLSALPVGLQLAGVEASGRAAGLMADAQQQPDRTVRVVLISLGEQTVEAGSGPVLDMNFTVHGSGGQSNVALAPTDVRVAGTDGELDATARSGQLQVEGGSTATTLGDNCALDPTRSAHTLWLLLTFVVVLLIVRSLRCYG